MRVILKRSVLGDNFYVPRKDLRVMDLMSFYHDPAQKILTRSFQENPQESLHQP